MTKSHEVEFVSSLSRNGRNSLRVILAHEDGATKLREALGMREIRVMPQPDKASGLARAGRTIDLFRDAPQPNWRQPMRTCLIAMFVLLCGFVHASAKDAKEYQTGVVSSVERSTGWIDTTRCSGPTGYVQCDGGIQNTSEDVRTLNTADGLRFVIHHQMGRPNTVKSVADGTQVHYRWERHMGVDVLLIVVPGNSKEGWYCKEGRK
jgi:hypothetical protein